MDVAQFWNLIERTKTQSRGDNHQQVNLLREQLATLPPNEIIEFDRILWQLMAQSYAHELWAAAYILNGGCSDDCFDYFRGWLIAQGQDVFNEALRDPETLASLDIRDDVELETILYTAQSAYEERTGGEMPQEMHEAWHLTGQEWNDEDLEQRYPKLVAKSPNWS